MPAISRPGNIRSRLASSIAVRATFRSGTGSKPMPTRSLEVEANATAAAATPLSLKQSSHTHSSSRPPSSALLARLGSRSGGRVGTKVMPSAGGRAGGGSALIRASWPRAPTTRLSQLG